MNFGNLRCWETSRTNNVLGNVVGTTQHDNGVATYCLEALSVSLRMGDVNVENGGVFHGWEHVKNRDPSQFPNVTQCCKNAGIPIDVKLEQIR